MTTYKEEHLRPIDSREVVNHSRAGVSRGLQGAKATGQTHGAWRTQSGQNVGVLESNRVQGGHRRGADRFMES